MVLEVKIMVTFEKKWVEQLGRGKEPLGCCLCCFFSLDDNNCIIHQAVHLWFGLRILYVTFKF